MALPIAGFTNTFALVEELVLELNTDRPLL
jgi:hypothetical protein